MVGNPGNLKLGSVARGRSRSWAIRAEATGVESSPEVERKKVVVVGAGWAGLGAAHHLTKQVSFTFMGLEFKGWDSVFSD